MYAGIVAGGGALWGRSVPRMIEIGGAGKERNSETFRNEAEAARGMADDFARAGQAGWDGAQSISSKTVAPG